ncbi:MAG: hypothetical protein MMC23_008730 [Stictis urceolatum]|nr:hypothetical protein [Stictis urceolata]
MAERKPYQYDNPPRGAVFRRLFKLDLNESSEPLSGYIVYYTNLKEALMRLDFKTMWMSRYEDENHIAKQLGIARGYDALSWVWGPPSASSDKCLVYIKSIAPRLVKGKVDFEYQPQRNGFVKIRPALYDFLCEMRKQKYNRLLWIDALCIDQSDPHDKNLHIPFMKNVYEDARNVRIWLGAGNSAGKDALQRLRSITGQLLLCSYRGINLWNLSDWRDMDLPPSEDDVWVALRSILTHPWWSRLWTLQEVVMAKMMRKQSFTEVMSGTAQKKEEETGISPERAQFVLYGDMSVAWSAFEEFARAVRLCHLEYWVITGDRFITVDDKHAFDCIEEVRTCQGSFLMDGGYGLRLGTLLLGTKRRLATTPADMVIGQSALLDSKAIKQLRLDSSLPAEKVFVAFGQYYVRQEPAECLLNHVALKQAMPGLPSWCPNFASRAETLSLGSRWLGTTKASDYHESQMYHAGFDPAQSSKYQIPHSKLGIGKRISNVCSFRSIYHNYYSTKDPRQVQLVEGTSHIRLSGVEMDEVTDIVDCIPVADFDEFLSPVSIHQTIDWDKACLELVRRTLPPFRGREDFEDFEVYARTMTANHLLIRPSYDDLVFDKDGKVNFAKAYHDIKGLFQRSITTGKTLAENDLSLTSARFARMFLAVTRRRRFFVTRHGRIGIGPSDTEPGDKLCVIFYCPTPYLLRPVSNRYRLVGETYVHGLMYGEALKMLDSKRVSETQWIVE